MTKYQEILQFYGKSVEDYLHDKKDCEELAKTFYWGLLDYLGCSTEHVKRTRHSSSTTLGSEPFLDWADHEHMFLSDDGLWHVPLRVELGPTGVVLWLHFRKSELENVRAPGSPRPFNCLVTNHWPIARTPRDLLGLGLVTIGEGELTTLFEMFFQELENAVSHLLFKLKVDGHTQHFDLLTKRS